MIRKYCASLSCIGLLLGGMGGYPASAGEMAGAGEMLLFEDIPSVFGASKYEQKMNEAPSSVSIITAQEIEKYGHRNLSDILRSVRSFYVSNDHTYEYVGVRGFGLPGDYNTRLLVLIDGHRVNENIYASFGADQDFLLDVDLIDRIEIIRGPSSSLYGTGAFFGVINIYTKRGRDYQGAQVSAAASSHDTHQGRITYGNRFDNGVELLLSGTAYDSSGRDWYYAALDDPATNNGVADGQDMERSVHLLMKAAYGDFVLNSALVRRDKDGPTAAWGTEFNENMQLRDQSWYVDLFYEHVFDNQLTLSGRVSYNNYVYDGNYPYWWTEEDIEGYELALPEGIYDGIDVAEGRWMLYELQAGRMLWEKHKVVVGAEYRDNIRQDQDYFDIDGYPDTQTLASSESDNVWALYIQDEIALSDKLILNIGVRHDEYDSFGNTTNPRVALIYNPFVDTSLKFLYGEAFRAPNVYESYYEDGWYQKGNPDLQPEEIETYEVVWEQNLADNLRSVVSLFYYEIDNIIRAEDANDDNYDPEATIFVNQELVKAKGIELELEGKWRAVEGRISYTYQETEDDDTGDILSNSPRNLFKFNLNVPLWEERLYSGLEIQYMSDRETPEGVKVDGFAVTNINLFSNSLFFENLSWTATIFNLFDKGYRDSNSTEHYYQPDGIEQDGRTFRLKLTYTF